MKSFVSKNVSNIQLSGIRQMYEKIQKYPPAIPFLFGEPDFQMPTKITKSIANALISGKTSYTSNMGIKELRIETSRYLKTKGISFSADEICLTAGCTEGLICAFTSILNKGDNVLIPNPGFPSYVSMINLCGANPIYYDLNDDFSINFDDLLYKIENFAPKALVLSFPSNPTGSVLTQSEMEHLYEIIKLNDFITISDEIYCEICFTDFYTPIQHPDIKDKFILVSGFSKMFAMTGLRVGYVCASKNLIKSINKVHSFNVSCAPSISQWGALVGLQECMDDLYEMKKEYIKRKDYMCKRLKDMGLDFVEPQGGFFVFPSIKKFNISSEEFCNRLLNEAEVGLVPGSVFGKKGEGYIRISYTTNFTNIEKGLNRIENWLKTAF